MPFIVSTGTKKPDPESRKLIRSHVMLGKNRGRTLRPRPNKIIELSGTEDSNEGSSSLGEHVGGSLVEESLSIIPRKVGSDLSFIQFADTIEESTVAVILQCKPHLLDDPHFAILMLSSISFYRSLQHR